MSQDGITRIGATPRLSMAVAHGGVVHLSGQVAIAAGGGDVTDQTREILGRIDTLLAEAGTDRSRLLSVQLLLSDMALLPQVNAEWDRWITPGAAPARTTIQTVLASPRYALEIAVIAAV
ncbi:MAG: RidA family protein [Sphingomonas bacterium]|nr:RidA family protein [Sphingomonas bacterium]